MKANIPSPDISPNVAWPILIVFIVIGAGLRIYHMESGLWYDEIKTLIDSVRVPLAEIVTHFPTNNDHKFYSVLAHLSIAVFGEHAWSLRLPAVIFGIAALPMLYLLGTMVTSRLEALFATGLLTLSYHHVWFTQNARGYTILLFLTLLATYLLLIGLKDNKRKVYIIYAVVTALGAYTHLTMVFTAISHAVVVLFRLVFTPDERHRTQNWINPALGFLLAGIFTLCLYAPVLPEMYAYFGKDSGSSTEIATISWAIREALEQLSLGYGTIAGVILGGFVCLVGCWSYFRQSPTLLALFVFPGLMTLAIAILLQHPVRPRFVFFLAGFALLIAVRGLMTIFSWIVQKLHLPVSVQRFGFISLILAMIIVSIPPLRYGYSYPKQDYEGALQYVEVNAGSDDLIVIVGGGAGYPYQQYYEKPWPQLVDVNEFNSSLNNYPAVWLLYTFPIYIKQEQPALFDAIRAKCTIPKSFPGTLSGGRITVHRCTQN